MESEFVAQLMALTIDKQRRAELAKDVEALMSEFSTPIDRTREVRHRAIRAQLAQSFCNKWSVSKSWVSDLIDRYEENTTAAEQALHELSSPVCSNVPGPRPSSDRATQRSA